MNINTNRVPPMPKPDAEPSVEVRGTHMGLWLSLGTWKSRRQFRKMFGPGWSFTIKQSTDGFYGYGWYDVSFFKNGERLLNVTKIGGKVYALNEALATCRYNLREHRIDLNAKSAGGMI